jgi:hypothetical protein
VDLVSSVNDFLSYHVFIHKKLYSASLRLCVTLLLTAAA